MPLWFKIFNRLLRIDGIKVIAKDAQHLPSISRHQSGTSSVLSIRNGAHARPRARVWHNMYVCTQANQEIHKDIGTAHL